MTLSVLPIIVAVVGLLLYCFAPSGKAQTIGDRMFFAGLLAALLQGAHSITIH